MSAVVRVGEVLWERELAGGYTASVVRESRTEGTLSLISKSGILKESLSVTFDSVVTQQHMEEFELIARSLHDRQEGAR